MSSTLISNGQSHRSMGLLIVALLLSHQLEAQEVAHRPFSVSASVGCAIPYSNIGGHFFRSSNDPTGSAGISMGAKARYELSNSPFTLVAIGNVARSFFEARSSQESGNPPLLSLELRNLSFGVGVEYYLWPSDPFTPYLGMELTTNIINGSYSSEYNKEKHEMWKLIPATRYGVIACAGITMNLTNIPAAIELEADYHWLNLLGKAYGPSTIAWGSGEFRTRTLNDLKDPDDAKDRNREIHAFTLSVAFRYSFF
jgi:hypothetical protein